MDHVLAAEIIMIIVIVVIKIPSPQVEEGLNYGVVPLAQYTKAE